MTFTVVGRNPDGSFELSPGPMRLVIEPATWQDHGGTWKVRDLQVRGVIPAERADRLIRALRIRRRLAGRRS